MKVTLNRQLIGLEDIVFGEGTVEQTRGGQIVEITKINAANLPFDEIHTLQEVLDAIYPLIIPVGEKLVEIQAVYDNIDSVVIVATELTNTDNIETVGVDLLLGVNSEIRKVNTIATEINQIVSDVIPNLDEILAADENAALARRYANEDEDVEVEAGLFSAKHYAIKALELVTDGVIDDETASDLKTYSSNNILDVVADQIDDTIAQADKTYSSSKVQTLHDAQAQAIANLSGANASFYNNSTTVIPESPDAYIDLTWATGTQSSNTDIFELGTNEIVFKRNGIYTFLNTLTYYRTGSGAACVVNYEIYDADTNSVIASLNQDLAAGTKETVPMNASLTLTGITTTKRVKVRARVTTAIAGTVELFTFNSLLALATATEVVTGDAIDDYLGSLITGVLI